MRLVAWNCNMALHRKLDALRRLEPDIAVISECASPERLQALGVLDGISDDPIWIGDNPTKGLAVRNRHTWTVVAVAAWCQGSGGQLELRYGRENPQGASPSEDGPALHYLVR